MTFEDWKSELRFISVCEDMVGRGQLESEFKQVLELLTRWMITMTGNFEELGKLVGMTDIDWKLWQRPEVK